jgi:hypothetical protein
MTLLRCFGRQIVKLRGSILMHGWLASSPNLAAWRGCGDETAIHPRRDHVRVRRVGARRFIVHVRRAVMSTCPHCLRASDSVLDADAESISAARLLWRAMRQAMAEGKAEFPLAYYVGFSHALNLCAVISHDEWSGVQSFVGRRGFL